MKTIKARFHNGLIEPMEKLDIEEGVEIFITILNLSTKPKKGGFERSAGSWADTVDAEELIRNIYADRLIINREVPEL